MTNMHGRNMKPSQPASLQRGVEQFDAMVREVRERQHVFTGNEPPMPSSIQSPSEIWQRKYLSQGIGPEEALACLDNGTCYPRQAQLMSELQARVAQMQQTTSRTPMRRPFAPGRAKRRSWLARLFFGN